MSLAVGLATAALLLSALAILPGTLGMTVFTHNLAATATGARLIYEQSKWGALVSVALMAGAVFTALQRDSVSVAFGVIVIAYAGILVFGFLMHVGLLFKPVRKPVFIPIEQAIEKYGEDEEVIGVVDVAGTAFAFITNLARRPHVVYQPAGDDPFVMSHCILAHSSMAYPARGGFSKPDILVVAVQANNMVFYEKNKRCAVIQIQNRSRQGEIDLEMLPTVSVKLKTWHSLYPESHVWVRNKSWRDVFYLQLLARADVIDPASPVMIYPTVRTLDDRLPMKSQVVGVQLDNDACAYPAGSFADVRLINDKLGDRSLLLASAFEGDFIQVFDRTVETGLTLDFAPLQHGDGFTDTNTHSVWSPTGTCLQGELSGRQLIVIPHYNKIFWYVWADFHPGTRVYCVPPRETDAPAENAA